MNADELLKADITAASEALERREVTAVALTEAALEQIRANRELNAVITTNDHAALAAAEEADHALAKGRRHGPLHGIPLAIKDNIPMAGLRTTYNSRAYEDWTPHKDAAAVERLRHAGAVIVAKTNLNELGWSVPDEADLIPPPRNPWNTSHLAVGSSSGSAVAVAAGMCLGALGTDGGGSTRLPASQMNLLGLKPTRGAVPGVSDALDEVSVVGVLARSPADAATIFATVANRPVAQSDPASRRLRLAVPRRQIEALPVEPEVRRAFDSDMLALADLGAELIEVDLSHIEDARDANFVLIAALAHAAHCWILREAYDAMGVSARRYHLAGAMVSVEDCVNARRVGNIFQQEMEEALESTDALVTPVSTVATTEAARRPGEHNRGLNSTFTAPFNVIGWPALSIPSGHRSDGIPIGLQVAARPNQEELLLQIAMSTYSRLTVGESRV